MHLYLCLSFYLSLPTYDHNKTVLFSDWTVKALAKTKYTLFWKWYHFMVIIYFNWHFFMASKVYIIAIKWHNCIKWHIQGNNFYILNTDVTQIFTDHILFFFFFNCYLAAPWPTLCHYRGDNLTHPMLITAFYIFDPRVTGSLVTMLGP